MGDLKIWLNIGLGVELSEKSNIGFLGLGNIANQDNLNSKWSPIMYKIPIADISHLDHCKHFAKHGYCGGIILLNFILITILLLGAVVMSIPNFFISDNLKKIVILH